MYNVPLIITVVGIICVVAIVIFVRLYTKRRTSIPRFIRRKTRRNTDSHHQNVPMSLQLCLDDYLTTGNAEMLIVCGDVYRSGVYPLYRGNPAVAEMCYRTAALLQDTPENTSVRALGLTRLLELTFNEIQPVDVPSNFTLPEQPGIVLCELVESQRHRSPDVTRIATLHTKEPVTIPAVIPEYTIDTQNVHDHSVIAGVHKLSQSLESNRTPGIRGLQNSSERGTTYQDEGCGPRNPGVRVDTFRQATKIISDSDTTPETKRDARRTLDTLSDNVHSKFGMSEREALSKVISTIASYDETLRKNIFDTLVLQLASGVEHDTVVCSTGKITRIIGTLDGCEIGKEGPRIVPTHVVNTLIANEASKARDAGISKEQFVRESTQKWVDESGMSADIVGPVIELYSEYVE